MNNRLKNVTRIIYKLKRLYGIPAVLINKENILTDLDTGAVTYDNISISIKRAVALPEDQARTFAYDLSYIVAAKNFSYGGFYDKDTRWILLDGKDVGSFTISEDTKITVEGSQYFVKMTRPIVGNLAYLIKLSTIESAK